MFHLTWIYIWAGLLIFLFSSGDFMIDVKVQKIKENAIIPKYAHSGDAGLDLYNLEDELIGPGRGKAIHTGISLALSKGFVGLVADRSSLAKKGLKTAGGVIDAGYRGEIIVVFRNLSDFTKWKRIFHKLSFLEPLSLFVASPC